jgi:hypothetical protein
MSVAPLTVIPAIRPFWWLYPIAWPEGVVMPVIRPFNHV